MFVTVAAGNMCSKDLPVAVMTAKRIKLIKNSARSVDARAGRKQPRLKKGRSMLIRKQMTGERLVWECPVKTVPHVHNKIREIEIRIHRTKT
jgi:hypothetical protein